MSKQSEIIFRHHASCKAKSVVDMQVCGFRIAKGEGDLICWGVVPNYFPCGRGKLGRSDVHVGHLCERNLLAQHRVYSFAAGRYA